MEPRWKGGHATPEPRRGKFVSQWFDEKDRCYRRIEASMMRWTRTSYDIELHERESLPCEERDLFISNLRLK